MTPPKKPKESREDKLFRKLRTIFPRVPGIYEFADALAQSAEIPGLLDSLEQFAQFGNYAVDGVGALQCALNWYKAYLRCGCPDNQREDPEVAHAFGIFQEAMDKFHRRTVET